jgi:HK97 family phage prohead protease
MTATMKKQQVKRFKIPVRMKELSDDAPEGSIQAMFSVFNVVDESFHVVMPSFFKDGQEVVMAAWGHNWGSLPVGKGVIRVESEGAVFDGQFFLNTQAGREHYETVKAVGPLQEWSFGFRVLEARPGEFDGQEVLFLMRGEIFEVSPVLIGDNRETMTLDVKSLNVGQEIKFDEVSKKAFIENNRDLVDAMIDKAIDSASSIMAVKAYIDVNVKEGRAISTARRNQMGEITKTLRSAADAIEQMLKETEPKGKEGEPVDGDTKDNSVDETLGELMRAERLRSELLGVSLEA